MNTSRSTFNPAIFVQAGAVGATYAAFGSPTTLPLQWISIYSTLNDDVMLSIDGSTDVIYIPTGASSVTLNLGLFTQTSSTALPQGTQFFAKAVSTLPTTGALSIIGVGLIVS